MGDDSIIDLKRFAGWADPGPIYDSISIAAAVFAAIIPVMIGLVFILRFFSEASENLSGKARIGDAAGSVIKASIFLFAYAGGGALILVFAVAFSRHFYQYGSFSIISAEFYELITQMKAAQQDYDANFLERFMDLASIGSAPVAYVAYLAASSLFLVVYISMRLAYAMLFGLIYLWGFIAIPTVGLKGVFNLSNGWMKSIIGLILWPVVEATTYLFAKFTIIGISEKLDSYSGTTIAMFTAQHAVMAFICLFLAVLSVLSFYFTARLIQNDEALTGVAAPVVAGGLMAFKFMRQHTSDRFSKAGSFPSVGGDRLRDSLASGMSGFNEHPVQSLKNISRGLGNLASNIKGKFS